MSWANGDPKGSKVGLELPLEDLQLRVRETPLELRRAKLPFLRLGREGDRVGETDQRPVAAFWSFLALLSGAASDRRWHAGFAGEARLSVADTGKDIDARVDTAGPAARDRIE